MTFEKIPPMQKAPTGPKLALPKLLLILALAGAGYLAFIALTDGQVAGCGSSSSCQTVLQSPWAYWLNLPVSVPAFLVYAAMLACAILAGRNLSSDSERGTWAALVVLSSITIGGALWFVGLQLLIIKAVCFVCMGVHLSAAAAAVICLTRIPLSADATTPMWSSAPNKRGVPGHAVLSLVLIGVIGLAILAGGQLVAPTARNLVKVIPVETARPSQSGNQPPASSNIPVPASSPNLQRVSSDWVSLYQGQFSIMLNEVPMMGSPQSSNIVVYLFDYTCSHCRDLHHILASAQRQLSNTLGIVTLPMPMSSNCNRMIPADFTSSAEACEFARIGLALWRKSPEKYYAYDSWFFAQEPIPSLETATGKAHDLLGKAEFEKVSADSWIEQQIDLSTRLHFANWQASGRPAMPQIVMGTAISVGPLTSVRHLYALLSRYLGIEPPPRVRPEPGQIGGSRK